MTLLLQPAAVATTQLAHSICIENSPAELTERIAERTRLSMSWVVVTGEDGKRQLRMRWTVAEEELSTD